MVEDKIKIRISEEEWGSLPKAKKRKLRELMLAHLGIDIFDVIQKTEDEDDEYGW